MEKNKMTVADFFCGGGGFSEGFRQAGFDIVFGVDKWEPAVKTFNENKGKICAIKDDVIRLSNLSDEEFNRIIPDTEIIIGSPPCTAFSGSNKSGNGEKELGIKLIRAYLKIIARKKFKENSILKYWVFENVPNVEKFLSDVYSAKDLDLQGDFNLKVINNNSKIYNAKYFGAPTNRKRFICGEFPDINEYVNENEVKNIGQVLESLASKGKITDPNYPDLIMEKKEITDFDYECLLADFEWKKAKKLKEDKGYMGKMSFPECLNKPSRTIMATMSASSRESFILKTNDGKSYRLPTVREIACFMSFPIDYKFYGKSKGVKYTLVGNAVPPKLSYAIAKSIAEKEKLEIPNKYLQITKNISNDFYNLNGVKFEIKKEKEKKSNAKYKYHIPYFIIKAFRVELSNYGSDFANKNFEWNASIHYSQGKKNAKIYFVKNYLKLVENDLLDKIRKFISEYQSKFCNYSEFQRRYCLTITERKDLIGPDELLESVKEFIENLNIDKNTLTNVETYESTKKKNEIIKIPYAILIGYVILEKILVKMRGKK